MRSSFTLGGTLQVVRTPGVDLVLLRLLQCVGMRVIVEGGDPYNVTATAFPPIGTK